MIANAPTVAPRQDQQLPPINSMTIFFQHLGFPLAAMVVYVWMVKASEFLFGPLLGLILPNATFHGGLALLKHTTESQKGEEADEFLQHIDWHLEQIKSLCRLDAISTFKYGSYAVGSCFGVALLIMCSVPGPDQEVAVKLLRAIAISSVCGMSLGKLAASAIATLHCCGSTE